MSEQIYPQKMYASTIIKDVTLYKDFNFKEKYEGIIDDFDVEFIGKKARVICNSPLVDEKDNTSRLNKLSMIGSWTGGEDEDKYGYALIVNGKEVYFIVEHNINEDE
jgi:hypothetical protein